MGRNPYPYSTIKIHGVGILKEYRICGLFFFFLTTYSSLHFRKKKLDKLRDEYVKGLLWHQKSDIFTNKNQKIVNKFDLNKKHLNTLV